MHFFHPKEFGCIFVLLVVITLYYSLKDVSFYPLDNIITILWVFLMHSCGILIAIRLLEASPKACWCIVVKYRICCFYCLQLPSYIYEFTSAAKPRVWRYSDSLYSMYILYTATIVTGKVSECRIV